MTKIPTMLATLLLFGVSFTVCAQDQNNDRDHDWYQNRDSFYHGEHWRAHMFDRVRDDIERVQSTTFPIGGDQFRLVRTKEQLNELQSKLTAGRYDEPELTDVISSLRNVVASNKLSPRDRDMLRDDLQRLRDYREHHDHWANQ